MTVTVAAWLAACPLPRKAARQVVAALLQKPVDWPITHSDACLSDDDCMLLTQAAKRHLAGEPLAKITSRKEFYGITFYTNRDTLDPRPDSETLIDTMVRLYPDRQGYYQFLDIGTGTGCLLLTTLTLYPQAAGLGIDCSLAALAVAERNRKALQLTARATLQQGDYVCGVSQQFDVIFANPPYIATAVIASLDPAVRLYDPLLALDGGNDGLDAYQRLLPMISAILYDHGRMFLEIGCGQQHAVSAIAKAAGLIVEEAVNDLGGVVRCLVLRKLL